MTTIKNRGWVKNAAIIFLAVLLILTFFSNTILNYSLPEVSGQGTRSGDIATAIRGTGTVTANEAFNIELEETRQIKTVYVKAGDVVEAGQVLFELEESDGDELKEQIALLESMQYDYNRKLLAISSADYDSDNLAIKRLREDLEIAVAERDMIGYYEAQVDAAKAEVRKAQDKVEALQLEAELIEDQITALKDEASAIQERIDNIDLEIDEDLLTGEMKELRDKRNTLADELAAKEKALAKAEKDLVEAQADSAAGDTTDLQNKIIAAKDVVTTRQLAKNTATHNFISAMEKAYGTAGGYTEAAPQIYKDYCEDTDGKKSTWFSQLQSAAVHTGQTAVLTALSALQQADNSLWYAQSDLADAEYALTVAQNETVNLTSYRDAVKAAEAAVETAKEKHEAAVKAFDNATKDLRIEGKESQQLLRQDLTAKNVEITEAGIKLKGKNAEIKTAQRDVEDAETKLAAAKADAGTSLEAANEQIKSMQRNLEDMLLSLAQKQDSNTQERQLLNLELEQARKGIEEQEQLVEDMRGKAVESQVTTRYGGVVLSVGGIAGDKINKGTAIASIEINGKGFTLSFSVSLEESRRVRIGDTSVISSFWGEDTVCTLTAIKPDPENPGRRMLLEFDVTGNVSAGQSFNVTLGERTTYYDHIVPNSAVREDQNGTFVLVAEQTSTPLGTRYIAQRYDVEVLAKDSTNAAVSGDFEWGMYIITATTKPVEPGTQVRLIGS